MDRDGGSTFSAQSSQRKEAAASDSPTKPQARSPAGAGETALRGLSLVPPGCAAAEPSVLEGPVAWRRPRSSRPGRGAVQDGEPLGA